MRKSVLAPIRVGMIGLLAMSPVVPVHADDPTPAVARASTDAPLSAELVKTGLYLIKGGGSNSLLRLSASGSILVDGKLPGQYRPLMSQVRRISKLSDLPARVLVVTDHHAHHIGNHAQFVAAGVAVLAQENARPYLPDAPTPAASGSRAPAPTVTFERDYRLRMGGVEVQLHHFGKGHTNDDVVVHFPDLKVVALGDLVGPDAPMPDFAGGGSLVGWARSLDEVLKLDFELAVPSDGPVLTRADVLAFKGRVDALVSRATALMKQGVDRERFVSQLDTEDLGWHLSYSVDQFDRLRADLSAAR